MTQAELINCLMTDAIEGPALAYWAEAKDIKENEEGLITSFKVRDNGEEGERESTKWVTITPKKVEKAAKAIREGDAEVSRDIMSQFCGKEWEYDANGIDCLIQYIVFGKIIFG